MPPTALALRVALLLSVGLAGPVGAVCEPPDEPWTEWLQQPVLERVPVEHREAAEAVRIVGLSGSGRALPFATSEGETPVVVVPDAYVDLLCTMVLTTGLEIDGTRHPRKDALLADAASCLEGGRGLPECLVRYASELRPWVEERAGDPETADVVRPLEVVVIHALLQSVVHEYAHLLLDHPARVAAGALGRADAEFESDLFSVLNGVNVGEVPMAMFYLFAQIEEVERRAPSLATPDYESAACRGSNVQAIVGAVGMGPAFLVSLVESDNDHLTPEVLRDYHSERLADPWDPDAGEAGCGRLARPVLAAAHAEAQELFARAVEDVALVKALRPATEEHVRLAADFVAMAGRFEHLGPVAAKLASSIALAVQQELGPGFTDSDVFQSMIMDDEIQGRLLSRDYGRVLGVRGTDLLQHARHVPDEQRIEVSTVLLSEAVQLNPRYHEGWSGLAMIAAKQEECDAAKFYALRAYQTANDPEDRDFLVFVYRLTQGAEDPEVCERNSEMDLFGM